MRDPRRSSLLMACAVVVVCAGCAVEERTQIIVRIEAAPGVAARMESLHVVVAHLERGERPSEEDPALDRTVDIGGGDGEVELPAIVPLVPRFGDAERRFEVTAEALDERVPFAIVRARSGYVRHETRVLAMRFDDACADVLECEDAQTCSAGRCERADVDETTLPRYAPGARDAAGDATRDGAIDGDAARDASMDTGGDAGDAGPDAGDAGPDARPDATPGECTTDGQCEDRDPCTADRCLVDSQTCSHVAAADGAACGDERGSICCAGTCTPVETNPTSCGACGNVCGANARCTEGVCRCDEPMVDCDGEPGCESDPRIDPMHCGTCTRACAAPTPSCVDGACAACESDADCAPDSLVCTSEPDCEGGACTYRLDDDYCLIAGACVAERTPNPVNPCEWCDPSSADDAWSPRPSTPCDDGQFCTTTDRCSPSGTCLGGSPRPCDDGLACTNDLCDEDLDACRSSVAAGSCLVSGSCFPTGATDPSDECRWCQPSMATDRFVVHTGAPCDDGLFCTMGETCSAAGACTSGVAMSCLDSLGCTSDTCNEAENVCEHEPMSMRCAIAGGCYISGDPNPTNPCERCFPSGSQTTWSPVAGNPMCNDGRYCTIGDLCVGGACQGTMRSCDDEDPCTRDSCDDLGARCVNVPCGDNELCTVSGCRCAPGTHDCDGDPDNGCECTGPGCSGATCL